MTNLQKHDFRAAFGSTANAGGMILSAVSIYNLLAHLASMRLHALLDGLLHGYRTVFHTAADVLVMSWITLVVPAHAIPTWTKDVVIVYIIVGVAMRRALWPAYRSLVRNVDDRIGYTEGILWQRAAVVKYVGSAVHSVAYTLLWPALIMKTYKHPILYEERERDWKPGDFRRFRLMSPPYRDLPFDSALTRRYCYHLHRMLVLQLLASAFAVVFLSAANAVSHGRV